jgi:hypothetical protein
MADVHLDLKGMGVSELLAFAERLADGLEKNPHFPEAGQFTAGLRATKLALTEKNAAYLAQKKVVEAAKLERAALVDELRAAVTGCAKHVQDFSGGDPARIMSAGLPIELGVDLWPFNDPERISDLNASSADSPGQIDLNWDPVRGAAGYEAEISSDFYPPESWKSCGVSSVSKLEVEGLESGRRYWFRVRGVGKGGAGDWSEPVMKYAP